MPEEITDLEKLLDRIEDAEEEEHKVSLDAILDEIGRRSFGPIVLFVGLVTFAPVIGDIPGVPTIMGALLLLVAVQLLFNRDHFWLPGWLLKRSVSREKLQKALDWMRKPARFIDRLIRPRLTLLITGMGVKVIAAVCVTIALALPPMEVVPFSANGAGIALIALGLALIAHDGLFALLAIIVTITTFVIVGFNLGGS